MRLTCFGIVLALAAGFLADRTLAQPVEPAPLKGAVVVETDGNGTSAVSPQRVNAAVNAAEPAVSPQRANAASPQAEWGNEWEQRFGHQGTGAGGMIVQGMEVPMAGAPMGAQLQTSYGQGAGYASSCNQTPYLAWHRCPWTGRIHLIPYQKGYPEGQFPQKQNCINFALSSLPSRTQNQPQQQYLGYYDPMPNIITDKPSRCQLMLGYPDGNWTSSCQTDRGFAHCPGVDAIARGPLAEQSVTNQEVCQFRGGLCQKHGKNCPSLGRSGGLGALCEKSRADFDKNPPRWMNPGPYCCPPGGPFGGNGFGGNGMGSRGAFGRGGAGTHQCPLHGAHGTVVCPQPTAVSTQPAPPPQLVQPQTEPKRIENAPVPEDVKCTEKVKPKTDKTFGGLDNSSKDRVDFATKLDALESVR